MLNHDELKTTPWEGNLNREYKILLAGPGCENAEFLNIYVEGKLYNGDCVCLLQKDVIWLRDQLIRRFPLEKKPLRKITVEINLDDENFPTGTLSSDDGSVIKHNSVL